MFMNRICSPFSFRFKIASLIVWVCVSSALTSTFSNAQTQSSAKYQEQLPVASLISKARLLNEKNNFPVAVKYLNEALKRSPKSVEAYLLRGEALDRMGLPMKALQDLTKYIELRPNDLEGYIKRGDINNFNHDPKAAIDDYNKALHFVPDSRSALLGRGMAYASLERYDLAILDYESLLNKYPWDHEAWANLGIVYAQTGKKDQALQSFEKALKVEQNSEWRTKISRMMDELSVSSKSEKPKPKGPTRFPINRDSKMW